MSANIFLVEIESTVAKFQTEQSTTGETETNILEGEMGLERQV